MSPVISIVGKSGSGKTTLLEKLVPELRKRGYRVASIKHAQEIDFAPGKDSSRYLDAGSEVTAVVSPNQIVVIKPSTGPSTLEETVRLLGNEYDIILCEGFKQADAPKIEVHRKGNGPLLEGLTRLVAIVTDEPLSTRVRQFSFEDIGGLADLLEEGFIQPQQDSLSVYVNNAPLPLTQFPRQIISETIVALISSLKGGGGVRSLEVWLRRGIK